MVIGIPPTRAETGYGYIEAGDRVSEGRAAGAPLHREADADVAEQFVKAGNFFWNSGMFIWGARTLADALQRASAQDRAAAGGDRCQLRHSQVREDICPALSQVREHQHRLRGAGAALGQRRRQVGHLLHSGELRMERSGLVDGAVRASQRGQDDGAERDPAPSRASR